MNLRTYSTVQTFLLLTKARNVNLAVTNTWPTLVCDTSKRVTVLYICARLRLIHKAFRTRATLSTKPIRKICYFCYLPKLSIGFNGKGRQRRKQRKNGHLTPMNRCWSMFMKETVHPNNESLQKQTQKLIYSPL